MIKTAAYTKDQYYVLWNILLNSINNEYSKDPYPGLKISIIIFNKPYLRLNDIDLLVLAFMRLLIKYAYTTESYSGKFTLCYKMKIPTGEVVFTLGKSIQFRENGKDLPLPYALIDQLVRVKAEDYDEAELTSIFLRIYLSEPKSYAMQNITDSDINIKIWESLNKNDVVVVQGRTIDSISKKNTIMTVLKPSISKMKPFIVADIETLLINDVHVPYAVGFLVVRPGEDLSEHIETYFSEDYPDIVFPSFEERSQKILFDFIERIVVVVRKDRSINIVYFHNFSRFDGIILLKYFATHGVKYTFKPLMRNNRLYELSVYHGKKLLFRLRDSLTLLPSSLDNLAKNLCPHLGSKGTIQHDKVQVNTLIILRDQLLIYMKQDIRLLGGVMQKAQSIHYEEYKVDIITKLTISSLSLTIYRTNFYNPNIYPIHIPNRNEDTFIRRGYYGGHAETYIPKGENLKYYDINSLYPYIMKTFHMPGGKPVWHGKLEGQDIDSMYGYFEAHIVCPKTIKRPFLPYRDEKSKTLIFPTGEFVGVYFSEELKYARDLGYKITLLSGYSFQKMKSPFDSFVTTIYDNRQEAKKRGNDAMSYVCKLLMNSLYGRFGINPKCTITEICDEDQYQYLINNYDFILADKLSENYYIITYLNNTEHVPDNDWSPPRISAVYLAAAITACARIHMYPYISRPDCYYTDTDSVVLGSALPEEDISNTVLGKFKLEYNIIEGIFLAPKSYYILSQEGKNIIKHKGLAKALVNKEWFHSQYKDIYSQNMTPVTSNFKIEWSQLNITKKEILVNLGMKIGNKRAPIFDVNDLWVDTAPLDVTDFAGQENRIIKYQNKLLIDDNQNKNSEIVYLKNQITDYNNKNTDSINIDNVQSHSVINELPTLYNQPPKKSNKKKIYKKHIYSKNKKKIYKKHIYSKKKKKPG